MSEPPPGTPHEPVVLPPPRRPREQVLARAWGVYYAIWSVAVLLVLVLGAVQLQDTAAVRTAFFLLADLFVAIAAAVLTLRYFRDVWQQTHFPLWSVGRGFLASILLFLTGLLIATSVQPPAGLVVFGAFLLLVALILAFQLRWSLGQVPVEGWGAVGSLSAAAVGSSVVVVLTQSILDYGAVWLLMVLVWGACAVSAVVRTERVK